MTAEKQAAVAAIEKKADLVAQVADEIWSFAELSLQEEQSADLYCRVLEQEGFKVERGICNIPTAFSASYGSGRPIIGLLAEYDALSGLSQKGGSLTREELVSGGCGHGCGHNLLGAGAMAAALGVIAQRTAGFAGADLENLVNEAALLAARRSRKAITMEDIEEASMKVMAGPEKKSRVVTPEEKKLTAYHEAGHAVAGFYCKHHPRVHEITIIPRGQAGGYTMYLPEKDRSYVTKGEMFEDIVSSLGGRVAEQLILEDISTGASNDLQQATNIARQMITKYGFSERLGPVVYGTSQEETFLGRDLGQGKGYSETTAAEIDGEMRDIIDEAYETCRRTLTEHIDQLHALAKALMEREKLNEQQFNTIMAGGTLPPLEDPDAKQPEQTVQPAQPVETAEKAETAEHAEQAETAEQPTGQQPEQDPAPEQDAPEATE